MIPLVCIVGRPNVGKSTLFNRLVGRRAAIVQDDPGVTRDRLYGRGDWDGTDFAVVDTGGLTPADESPIAASILAQAQVGIDEADVLLFVVDARAGLTAEDEEVGGLLRQSGKPVLVVANKADSETLALGATEFYRLGLGDVYGVSAQHGRNLPDLLDALVERLREAAGQGRGPRADASDETMRVALVGRPNAGKSSLVNRLVGQDRMLVDDKPGTTRDPVDSLWEAGGRRFTLVDTAGIRRKAQIALDMEKIAVVKAIRALDRAEVAALVVDMEAGVAEQDARVANLAERSGRALVVLANKVDRVHPKSPAYRERYAALRERLRFIPWAQVVPVSARTGYGLHRLPRALGAAHAQWSRRVQTSVLNRFLADAVEDHHPAAYRGREVKLYYATQVSVQPPTFVFSVNAPEGLDEAYRRYLANRLREAFGFDGTPLRLLFRKRGRDRDQGRRQDSRTLTRKR